ncbi:solute carrier family 45 member 3-like [Mercenaria mercenaria]|uniref:solute carrier family 45 member 3-like n=1 Tax=Mercenaria mercenaria TaxID=6596 RepID=UPI00234EEE2E|nr:solute carrier family 45 member 3-like [Mercenaria mercenaria]XP_045175682.2 solute carrier family 45 member 3-like [Mercenaria mercenaria]
MDAKSEIRVRARTFSADSMTEENIHLLPAMPLPNPEMVVCSSEPKPAKLSLIKIFLLNAVVCGVEICACSGFTYIPPMLLKSGYTEENMSIILGLGPLLGFILVPIIGRASDRCRSRIGRRRPFILGLSSLLIMSLLIIPYNEKICELIFGIGPVAKSFSLLLLTLGVVLLDFTSQACLTPCEAMLSDSSKETDQQERVFIVYSLMVSLGGFLGYLITAIDWKSTTIGIYFKTQERTVFSMLTSLFSVLLLTTILAAKEKPLISRDYELNVPVGDTMLEVSSTGGESGYDTNGSENGHVVTELELQEQSERTKYTPKRTIIGRLLSLPRSWLRFILTLRFLGAALNLLRLVWISVYEKLPEPFQKLCDIPHVLRHLALAHFCSWTAIMGFNLFFTDFVGNAVYEGNPNAPEDSYLRNRFDEGVRMGSWGLLFHCITSAIYALFVEKLVSRFGCKLTYTFGMTSFIFAMFGMVLVQNVIFVNLMAGVTGFAYATVLTIPFILVSKYHSEKEVYFHDVMPKVSKSPVIPAPVRGIATDIATLDSAYFLSQVVLSCIMGYIVYMTGSVLSYMVTAGVMGVLSLYFIQNVVTCEQEMIGRKLSIHSHNGVL